MSASAEGSAGGIEVAAAVPGRARALLFVGLATLGALSVWFSTNAVATALGDELGFGSGQLAWLTIAVQFGFVAGTLLSAILNLTERMNARLLFAIAAVLAAAMNLLPVASESFAAWLVARFLTGFFLCGVYPPAMHVISGWYRVGRGFALGVVIGALTLGSGSPHLLRSLLTGNWQVASALASALASVGAGLMWFAVRDGLHHTPLQAVRPWDFWRGLTARGRYSSSAATSGTCGSSTRCGRGCPSRLPRRGLRRRHGAAARHRGRQPRRVRRLRPRRRELHRGGGRRGALRTYVRHFTGDARERRRRAGDRVPPRLGPADHDRRLRLGLDRRRQLRAVLRRDDGARRPPVPGLGAGVPDRHRLPADRRHHPRRADHRGRDRLGAAFAVLAIGPALGIVAMMRLRTLPEAMKLANGLR